MAAGRPGGPPLSPPPPVRHPSCPAAPLPPVASGATGLGVHEGLRRPGYFGGGPGDSTHLPSSGRAPRPPPPAARSLTPEPAPPLPPRLRRGCRLAPPPGRGIESPHPQDATRRQGRAWSTRGQPLGHLEAPSVPRADWLIQKPGFLLPPLPPPAVYLHKLK